MDTNSWIRKHTRLCAGVGTHLFPGILPSLPETELLTSVTWRIRVTPSILRMQQLANVCVMVHAVDCLESTTHETLDMSDRK